MIARLPFFSSIFLLFLCSCFHPSKTRNEDPATIRTIGIQDSLPYFSDSSAPGEDNFYYYPPKDLRLIYFYKNYRFYRIATYKEWNFMQPVNDSVMEGRVYKSDTIYYYYARRDTSPVIYRFHSLTDPVFIKLPVDSLYSNSSVYREPSVKEEEIWENMEFAGTHTKGELVTDLYLAKPGRPENYPDSFLLVYSKDKFWNDIPFAFSNTAEARKKMKFVKFKLASNGDPGSKYITMIKPRMIASEMIEVHPSNEKELLNAFLAFENFLNNQ